MWGEWSPLKKLIWLHIVLGGGGGTSATVTGASPLALVNALAKPIKKLIQYGKCTTVNSETYCNNGKLVAVDDELPAEYERQIGFKFSASTYYRISDFHLRGTDTVRISFSADKACNVFGCYTDTSAEDNYSLYASTSSGGKYLRYDGDTYSSYIPSSQVGERLDVVITPTGTTGMPTDSVITPVEFESVADLCIGTTSSSASSSKLDGNIWGNFIVDGRLTLIPCERLSDNVLGYYDPDSDTFYEPIGSAPTSLGVDTSHLTALSVDGTPEVLTIGEQTATVENLLAVDDIKDEQNIISGVVTRRCEAEISDGTTPSGRYIGEVGEGNIIVKVRETGYEGDVATFEADRAEPLNGLTVNVSPIQDLHGYDSPWPDGGGKNKMPPPTSISKPIHGTATDNNGKISISTDGNSATFEVYIPPFTFAESGQKIEMLNSFTGATIYFFNGTTQVDYFSMSTQNRVINSASMTALLGKTIDRYRLTINAQSLTGGTFGLMVTPESDPALTTFSPYSNICPISGRTSATVTRTGRNLFRTDLALSTEQTQAGITFTPNGDGSYTRNGTATSRNVNINFIGGNNSSGPKFIRLKKGVTYTTNVRLMGVTAESGAIWGIGSGYANLDATFTRTPAEDVLIYWATYPQYPPTTYTNSVYYPRLEIGETLSDFEPYAGNTYTIQLGDTVYGGSLDVVNGKMVVDRAINVIDGTQPIGENGIQAYGGVQASYTPVPAKAFAKSTATQNSGLASDKFSTSRAYIDAPFELTGRATNANIYFDLPETVTTRGQAITWFSNNPTQVVYELATPIEITLTPTQIETLLGKNNVWSDAGSVKAYVADAELVEHVTRQPMRTAEGSNTIAVTSDVDPVQLEVEYVKAED